MAPYSAERLAPWRIRAIFVAVFLAVALSGPIRGAEAAQPLQAYDGIRRFGGGELRYIGQIPFLRLSGSYYEMGFDYGVLLRDQLRQAFADYNALRDSVLSRYPWYARPFGGIALKMMARYHWRRVPEHYQQELRGIAEGSGIPLEDVVFSAVFMEIASTYCTAILSRTGRGLLHGRNLDFEPIFLGRYPVVVEYNPPGKFRCLSFSVLGYSGVFTGLNERGLSVSLNSAIGRGNRAKDTPVTYMVRQLLEDKSTLAGIEESIRGYYAETGWVLAVGSAAENDGALFDVCLDGLAKTPLGDRKHLYALNMYVDPAMIRRNTPVFVGGSHYNCARREAIEDYLRQNADFTLDNMVELLANADFAGYRNFIGTGNGTVNNERTLQTILFDLAGMEAVFACARGYSGWAPFYRYSFRTGEFALYRAENGSQYTQEVREYLDWYESSELALMTGDYKDLVQRTLAIEHPNPVQLMALDMVRKSEGEEVDPARFLTSLDDAISRYPDYGLLYEIKGGLLLSETRYDEASVALQTGLEARVLFPAEEIMIRKLLAETCAVRKDTDGAAAQARKGLALLRELGSVFAMGPEERSVEASLIDLLKEGKSSSK